MMYRLIALTGDLRNQRITVEQQPMTIGSDPECTVFVPDEEMAKKHAVLEHRPDGLYIRDLGSMNRILVNKREIRESRLKHGDMIEIGRTRFLVQALVQAEVAGREEVTPRRRRWRLIGAVSAAVLALVVALNYAARPTHAPLKEGVAGSSAVAGLPEPTPMALLNPEEPLPSDRSDDLEDVRADLAAIRETMKDLTNRPPAATQGSTNDRLGGMVQAMLADARGKIGSNELIEADQLLGSILILDAESLPASVERARLYELRGMPDAAIGVWSQVIDRNPDPDLFETAVGARLRLSRAKQMAETGSAGQVNISAVDQHKIFAGEDSDEVRILKVALKPASPGIRLDPDAVRVEISFFDEDVATRSIAPTRAVVPADAFRIAGEWSGGERKVINATYLVPKGFRDREARAGRGAQYYGYVVRVFYNRVLQDETARPKTLLERAVVARSGPVQGK